MLASNWDAYVTAGMGLDFVKLAVRCFRDGGSNMNENLSIVDQPVFVALEVAEIEKVAPVSGSSVHREPGKIVESHEAVENNEED